MEYSHVQTLTEEFGIQDTLDFKFNTLMEITDCFHMEYNEDLKKGLEENLRDKLTDLILEFESKLEKLKHTIATLNSNSPYY